MNLTRVSIILLAIAVTCWASSLLVPSLLGAGATWSEADESEYQQAFSRVHSHEHGDKGEAEATVDDQNRARLAELQGKLDAARSRGATAGLIARGAGLLFGLAGVALFFMSRQS